MCQTTRLCDFDEAVADELTTCGVELACTSGLTTAKPKAPCVVNATAVGAAEVGDAKRRRTGGGFFRIEVAGIALASISPSNASGIADVASAASVVKTLVFTVEAIDSVLP